ncbi:MAG TPA: ECF transporter S component [Candidatus Onthovivens sp.]|nr:ECF transporter S component [Candidatus Onthovivens sp.]
MKKMSLLHKISYGALFMALTIILSRFFALPYFFGLPFLKVSLAPSVVIFSSFYLGPVFGAIVGFGSDLLGSLMFPQGGPYLPLYGIPATLAGLLPVLIYKVLKMSKIDNKLPISTGVILLALDIFVVLFMSLNDSINYNGREYVFHDWIKISVITCFIALSIIFFIGLFLIKKYFKNGKVNKLYNIFAIAGAIYIMDFVFKIPISSAIGAFHFSYEFFIIFGVKILTGFISILIHIIIVLIALNIASAVSLRRGVLLESKQAKEEDHEKK